MATTPMIAISSMSAPVKASPLELTGAVDVVDAVVAGEPPSDGVTAGAGVTPVVGGVPPV
jgi:hypothetical protein